jgi:hypothetical protein
MIRDIMAIGTPPFRTESSDSDDYARGRSCESARSLFP